MWLGNIALFFFNLTSKLSKKIWCTMNKYVRVVFEWSEGVYEKTGNEHLPDIDRGRNDSVANDCIAHLSTGKVYSFSV